MKIPVLKIRNKDGNFIPINAIRGDRGKSAYEQAKEGGYTGTEEEFIAILNGLVGSEVASHYSDFDNPHKVTAEQLGLGKVVVNENVLIGDGANASDGGGAVGNGANAYHGAGAVGKGAVSQSGGGAVGSGARGNFGGGAIGKSAYASDGGGAVGNGASSQSGGAVGNGASSQSGGGAVGFNAQTSDGGGAVGFDTYASKGGGAVGKGAETSGGFSGGNGARTFKTFDDGSGVYIDAIQLGTGTNPNEKTLQVYDYQLLGADGEIPVERLPKPSGSYEGDYDIPAREFQIGGVGDVLLITSSSNDVSFVTSYGARVFANTSSSALSFGTSVAKFEDGVLTFGNCTQVGLNRKDVTYYYQVL